MAKKRMKYVRLAALRADRKPLLEKLQRLGVVEIETEEMPEGFSRIDTEAEVMRFERTAVTVQQALEVLEEAVPAKKGMLSALSGRREIDAGVFEQTAARNTELLQTAYRVLAIQKQKTEQTAERARLLASMAQLEPWETLDVSFQFSGTRTTAAFIGTLPALYTMEKLAELLGPSVSAFDGEILSAKTEQTCVFLLCPKKQASAMEQALRSLGFARPAGTASRLPAAEVKANEERRTALAGALKEADEELAQLAERREDLEVLADYYTVRADKYRAIGQLGHSRHTLLLTGYIPESDVPRLERELEGCCAVALEVEDADPETAPVKLQNNAFAAPAESLIEMYAMPASTDVDPTPVVSFFYYLFFGMMLSDAGYGLLLVLGTWFAIKKFRPEPGMRRNLKLFQYCGISTVFWGLIFGSFFGNAPEIIAQNFLHIDFVMPKLIDPIPDAVLLLVLGVALGFIQILTGMGIKFYMQWRMGDRVGAVCDTGFWMTALLGFAVMAAGIALPSLPVLSAVGAGIAVVSLLGLLFTAGREKKGPMKVVSGLASLYDITSYVSDLMSYSRLMALGLTTGVMAMVFNLLGAMFGGGVVGALLFLCIFVVGHALNLGINVLGAYVHTMRLQYVELFSKFYEGGGRLFQPFAFRSQYIRIKEETNR